MTPDKAVVTNNRLRAFNIGTGILRVDMPARHESESRHDTKKFPKIYPIIAVAQ